MYDTPNDSDYSMTSKAECLGWIALAASVVALVASIIGLVISSGNV